MKFVKENTIDLEDYRTPGAKVFLGRDRGLDVSIRSGISQMVRSYPKIKIIIPENVYLISPSFYEEFLGDVVRDLGIDKFFEKVEFECHSPFNATKAVKSILRIN